MDKEISPRDQRGVGKKGRSSAHGYKDLPTPGKKAATRLEEPFGPTAANDGK